MELKTKGRAVGVQYVKVLRITRQVHNSGNNLAYIAEHTWPPDLTGFSMLLTTQSMEGVTVELPYIDRIAFLDHLEEGDIIAAHSDGLIRTLYRVQSQHNFLFTTERCNSNCLMCSQPPRNRDDIAYYEDLHRQLIPMIPKDCLHLGITGGEPTLMGQSFFDLLALLRQHLPHTQVHCLTNGRTFAWPSVTEALARVDIPNLTLGIPLYSDYYAQHDYIVQAKGAYEQTMKGLYNLARIGQPIEIRIVLHQLTIPRLVALSRFIYKNLPFVSHVAFMGLEHQGYTPHNIDKLWIDPAEYMEELGKAVELLSLSGIPVSVYNTQLCVLPVELWPYSRKSISDWKNIYLSECEGCSALQECGGLFASGEKKHSRYIKRLT